ncbi:hypothetical protein DM02DRAFT_645847 [Periconia macrospinosa]|uniref:DNA-directed RNA polymerase III subunit RPC3 n=1 Tax=Periconia macrospinosa TaxID=97972 RepID=A0A2V1D909_9PLEO|nr:hypothetical protein DM02DRAFT_645847 [Periconia macrospinosa]
MSYTQRETPVLAELCSFLVQDIYGELASRVYSILARYGRQNLHQLVKASYLNRRQITLGLVTLVQSHLVFHSSPVSAVTAYEIDWQQSYALVRFGRVVKMVEDRFGKNASAIVGNLLEHGHTRIGDLKNAFFPPQDPIEDSEDEGVNGAGTKRKRTNGTHVNGTDTKVNGMSNGSLDEADHGAGDKLYLKTVDEFYDAIQLLMQQGWIMRVDETQYLSPGDFDQVALTQVLDARWNGQMPSGTKDKGIVAREVLAQKRSTRDAWAEPPQFATRKRKVNNRDHEQPNKRLKVNGANGWASSGGDGDFSAAEEQMPIRINREKIAVAMRTEQLVRLVEQRLGPTTARIYQIMLRCVESQVRRCFEEWPDPPIDSKKKDDEPPSPPCLYLVTAHDVEKQSKDFDICEGLDPHAVSKITGRSLDKSYKMEDPVDPIDLGHHERLQLIHAHIENLARDPFHFATWHSRAGHSQWQIEFEDIAKSLIQHEIENTVSAKKPQLGLKLIRALKKKGRLDERQIGIAMMMTAPDIRAVVNDLAVQGFIQTQEVPKVDRREAKHSIHLVWYDRQRAREKLLHDTYKGMIRIIQRIAFEKEKVQAVLEKAERTDVRGNESRFLGRDELDMLNSWKEVEERLLLQLFREDDLVAVLRDFCGPLVSA